MHLLKNYALASGLKVRKPFILEKFFPMVVDKYITLQTSSKYPSKCYDFWIDVVDLLKPVLDKHGISIVQIGTSEDKLIDGCYHTNGQTNLGQAAYIIRHSLLNLGVDSFSTHIASAFGKKIVALYSNNYVECVEPYWTESKDRVLLQPERKNGEKPSFSAEEFPKSINSIKPEEIVKAVCKLLDLPFEFNFETLLIGGNYQNSVIEVVPNQVLDHRQFGVNNLILRMDLEHNEAILEEQLKICPCAIITNKPINIDLLIRYKPHVKEIVYFLDHNHDVEWANMLQKLAVRFLLTSWMPQQEIDKLKIHYMDLGVIHRQEVPVKTNMVEIKDVPNDQLYFKSTKFLLSKGQIFLGEAAWCKNIPSKSFKDSELQVIDDPTFYKDLLNFRIIKKLT